ncbi:MAG: glycosyl transferase [Clostridia bacterium]|nr:glycosyl transferase [Clostridia bacterium]
MGLRSILKKNKALCFLYEKWLNFYYKALTTISPKWNVQKRYKAVFKKKINLKNPTTLEEKLQWLKLYDYNNNPLVHKCADKYAVRGYIEECGYGHILNELYGVYDDPKQIDWAALPQQFVLKWNFGCGLNLVCKDKEKFDEKKTKRLLKKWKKDKKWMLHAEMQYKYAPKKLLCEKMLVDEAQPNGLTDYKVYCFHGEPKAILVMQDRATGVKAEFFTPDWTPLENTGKYAAPETKTPAPACLKELIEVSKKLSAAFPFVRCDFYIVQDKLYFGEMTFTPAAGLYLSKTEVEGKDMTEFLRIK